MTTPRLLQTFGFSLLLGSAALAETQVDGINWRGPHQTGVIPGTGYPTTWTDANDLWTYPVKGGGTPVIFDGKLYAFGYYDNPKDLSDVRETLLCLDAVTGEKLWEHLFSDFISDVVYSRYGIGAPIIDSSTGNVYLQSSNGRCMAFTGDGKKLWELSLVEDLARLTFPNGRTGSAAIDGPLIIFHCVTANWGTTAPARDRLYAFDKLTGELVWYSTPGTVPDDSSFAMPVFADLDGHRVFYIGLGCGNIACVDARTGKPLWRFELAKGGVNSQVIPLTDDKIIVVHGKENVDSTEKGRLICLKVPTTYNEGEEIVLGPEAEVWRNEEVVAFTSSPTLVGDRLYTTGAHGNLFAIDTRTGKTIWKTRLGPDQLHASPTYGDGHLYVPLAEGKFFIIKPGATEASILLEKDLGTPCLGAPMLWAGKCYLETKDGLHCFGDKNGTPAEWAAPAPAKPSTAPVTSLQIIPAEFAVSPGGSQKFTIWGLDAKGRRVKTMEGAKWETFIPPTARVQSTVDAKFDGDALKAGPDAKISAGAFKATVGSLSATTRGRVVANLGYTEDFESTPLPMKNEAGEAVNFPPLPWLGARIKWYVLEHEGSKMIANRLDNILFQRTMNFFGDPSMSNYVLEADVATDGNRRILSTIGLVNQRYLIALVGNAQILEISSNHERLKKSVKFSIKPNTFYRLKTWVERKGDGSGVVHAKAWPRDEPEPAEWTLDAPVAIAHEKGAPAIFAFSPQVQKRVYIDNIKISSPN